MRLSPPLRGAVLLLAAAIVISLLLSGDLLATATRPISRLLSAAAAQFRDAGTAIAEPGAEDAIDDRTDPVELSRRYERIVAEKAKLHLALEDLEALKRAVGYAERNDDVALTARVISVSDDPADHSVIIDRGTKDGVALGMPAIVGDGVLLGKVAQVGDATARIRLLTDSASALAVTVRNTQGTVGVLEGDRGLSLAINLIPQGQIVTPGDIVMTSGAEPGIRRGLLIGTVEKVERGSQDAFQSATVLPFSETMLPRFTQLLRTPVDTESERP